MTATCTSRFSAATRFSRPVRTGSWNSVHQFGSTGSATATLRSGFTGSFGPANQDSGEAQSGCLKSGPNVQPVSAAAPASPARSARFLSILSIIWKSKGQPGGRVDHALMRRGGTLGHPRQQQDGGGGDQREDPEQPEYVQVSHDGCLCLRERTDRGKWGVTPE